ncbi:SHOCT domain-containing protein [Cohnella massiliensis]|uniref:SHOCT domain-containing protein n=1 Tax=Cohnella massiliensis TaxID=1816691 RepID=UPI0009BB5433|nr:SHOCT domain-containing protein [Cohnella massiliensis]
MMMGYGFGMGWIGWVVNLLVIIGVIYLVARLAIHHDTGLRKSEKEADRIAAERYARGEITEEEFMRIKDVLRNKQK